MNIQYYKVLESNQTSKNSLIDSAHLAIDKRRTKADPNPDDGKMKHAL